jgi:cytidylate kinase
MAHRIDRLTRILNISEAEARKKLEDADREQRAFFKRVYGKKDAPPDEFDLIINFDFLKNPQWAAGIVESAFTCKFGDSAAKRK